MDPNQQIQEQEKHKREVLEFYTSIIAHSYDKGSNYTNLIIMAGYAVFFTFWSNVKNEVNIIDARISVLYVIISVLFFIIWEIYEMIYSSSFLERLHKFDQVPPAEFKVHMERVKKETEKLKANFARFWIWELILTIIPGFFGALVLIISYVKTLII